MSRKVYRKGNRNDNRLSTSQVYICATHYFVTIVLTKIIAFVHNSQMLNDAPLIGLAICLRIPILILLKTVSI